ncbi:MarR family winged helix-turn-helix transcriptional regulator [Sessilibacter corallicola]|uniref:MarR family winged helix-turn-helix transcriptional regulator n=1 Tax=Sessilibacter corallicola TaxID=2904075 RepID=UPI003340D016
MEFNTMMDVPRSVSGPLLTITVIQSLQVPDLKLENQVCFSLYSASNALIRAYRPLLDALNLTYLQYMVMIVLWEHKTLNVKQVGHFLRLDSGTLTPLLKRLEEKALVVRRRSTTDERVREITLSSKGEELYQQAKAIPEQLACRISFSYEDAKQLKALADDLLKVIESK